VDRQLGGEIGLGSLRGTNKKLQKEGLFENPTPEYLSAHPTTPRKSWERRKRRRGGKRIMKRKGESGKLFSIRGGEELHTVGSEGGENRRAL